ncbi:MAG: 4-hydroxy-tetrahydrodipicolinate synthase [Deltaproteobacteria bacterium]|nr:MAG: 4-hydroxy-tetrahydrodipicolinate synthase [Deltaproteobacteria bacterium]
MFHGAIVATVTPFRNGKLDAAGLKKLVEFQIRNGTAGIVPCGTTGESATLSHDEHRQVIDLVVEAVDGRVPVIAGTGSNNTSEAVALTRYAKKAGADAALVITPYYNKPTQKGLVAHFTEVAGAADIPLVLYNVPGRTGVNMAAETVARLSEVGNIVGVKEASGNLAQICDILSMTPRTFCVLSGDDGLYFPMLALGAKGVISVVSNVAPRLMADLYDAFSLGQVNRAREIHFRLWPLMQALFIETNPIPAKTALAMMGKVREEFRLPLCAMSDGNRKALAKVLSGLKIL